VIDRQSDSTPLLTVSDSLPLIEFVSGIVAVARLNATSKDAVKPIARVVSKAGGTLLGSVATGADAGGLYGGYGYGYRQDSSANGGSPTDGSSTKPRRRRRRLGRPWIRPRARQQETPPPEVRSS